ncbi:MAG: radical SAM/SPASM domain-containing protein [Thermoplasmata archaeon]
MRILPRKKLTTVGSSLARNYFAGEPIYPFYASFKVTHKCNFRCKFCNVWKENTPDLSTEDVCKVLDNLGESSILVTSFEGGDPLLRDDVEDLLRYARSKPFYLLFTTSERNLEEYPMETYGKYIDFLHVSIDEGHRNLDMFDKLETFNSWGPILCVQTVVTRSDMDSLEEKVKRCHDAGAKIVVMAAVHLDNTPDLYPDPPLLKRISATLKEEYPNTIISPDQYFDKIQLDHGCSTSSVIIDSDGGLFYPCRVLGTKRANLVETSLMDYLNSDDARKMREVMGSCDRRCGWYQYFATSSFTSPVEVLSALKPYYSDIFASS